MATEREISSLANLVGRLVLRVGTPLVALAAFFVVASRLHVRPYMDAVRAFNRRVLNPTIQIDRV